MNKYTFLLGLVCFLFLLAGCQKEVPQNASFSEPLANKAGTCDDLRSEIDSLLAARPSTCTNDSDCACFEAGLSKTLPCGGVVSFSVYGKIQDVLAVNQDVRCSLSAECTAWACQPKCQNGQCVK